MRLFILWKLFFVKKDSFLQAMFEGYIKKVKIKSFIVKY